MRLKWKPNIDAGQEAGPYEIYGSRAGAVLFFSGKEIGLYPSWSDAVDAAEKHYGTWTK